MTTIVYALGRIKQSIYTTQKNMYSRSQCDGGPSPITFKVNNCFVCRSRLCHFVLNVVVVVVVVDVRRFVVESQSRISRKVFVVILVHRARSNPAGVPVFKSCTLPSTKTQHIGHQVATAVSHSPLSQMRMVFFTGVWGGGGCGGVAATATTATLGLIIISIHSSLRTGLSFGFRARGSRFGWILIIIAIR